MPDITPSIIQKVKDELNIQDDLPPTELYNQLHKYRNLQHPDRFTDSDRKKEAEEKFKKLNTLLQELSNFVEQETLRKKPSDLILLEKDFDLVKVKQEGINLEEEISGLRNDLQYKDYEIEDLKKQLVSLRSEKLDEKMKDLAKLYKPASKSLLSFGVTFLFTLVVGILTRVEQVGQIISRYSPFDQRIINYAIFAILVYIPLRYLKMIVEENKIQRVARKLKTPLFIRKFIEFIEDKDIKDNFTEMNVYEFLSDQLVPKNNISKFILCNIICLYSDASIDGLKDIFIFNLLNKELIEISDAERLDRKFRILKGWRYVG
jgi:hypothetical protein